jgi:hypothetical protein
MNDDDEPRLVAAEPLTVEESQRAANQLTTVPFDPAYCSACARPLPAGPGFGLLVKLVGEHGPLVRTFRICKRCSSSTHRIRRTIKDIHARLESAASSRMS